MSDNNLLTKYRPKSFEGVVGHEGVLAGLETAIKTRSSHSFLFSGPSGTGKTTLARIVAARLGEGNPVDLLEVDAAVSTGIDATRALCDSSRLLPLFGGIRAIIMDECHALSSPAWKSLLKIVEEPPPFLYWFFCTTDLKKVPRTIQTRCANFILSPVRTRHIQDYLSVVAEQESPDTTPEVIQVAARMAEGSPRQGLANLALVLGVTDGGEARRRISHSTQEANEGVAAVVQALRSKQGTWPDLVKLARPLLEQDPEAARLSITAYLGAVLKNCQDKELEGVLDLFYEFEQPYTVNSQSYPLLLSLGRAYRG